MTDFIKLIESEEIELESIDEALDAFFLDCMEESDLEALKQECTEEEWQEIEEAIKRRVSSDGSTRRVRSRAVRQRRATHTTGRTRTSLRQAARKAARTRRRNPAATRRGNRKRKRAMRIRKQRGIS